MVELASATGLDGHDYSSFRTAVGNSLSYLGDQTCNSPSNNYPHKSSINTTTESKRAVKQLIRYLKGTQHTCLRHELHGTVQKVCWNSLVVVTQIGPAFRLRAKALRDMQPKSETDNNQSQFMRSIVLRSQCLRREPGGLKHIELRWLATRKTSVGGSSGHEEQCCRSLHETSGWTENAVARKETWTSNLGRYE